ncbi:diguanylate cyclase domain-containing protein [Niveispirillum sp. KHB5.9]|uniref:diguanylate cyclase domain-containing protein n=1 Tax=Niveispirillum sp. KHB5.9 TaxID=3400269 RepID=UPI003A8942B0
MEARKAVRLLPMPLSGLSGTLLGGFVVRLAGWSMLIVLALTAIGYSTIYDRAERDALDRLQAHLLERGRTESAIFKLAASNMELFRDRFLALYADPAILPDPDFDAYFQRGADGATRLRPEYFDGIVDKDGIRHNGSTGFVGANQKDIPAELKRRLVITHHVLAQYGPAWQNRFINTNISMPENAMLMYWPSFAWGREVEADLDMTAFSVIRSTLISENPQRRPVWTPLYHDHTAKAWMVTYQLPVDYQGRHLLNAGHDVSVADLMDRLITDHLPGSYNFVLAADGHLVAHPLWMDRLRKELATINLEKLGDPGLLRVHALIRDSVERRKADPGPDDNVWIVEDAADDAYLAVTRLEGPDWWFIARYPKSLVAATAHQAASAIMAMGIAYFLAMLALVFVLLRRQVAGPILQLKQASEQVAAGEYAAVADGTTPLPTAAQDEIGTLARSFQDMAARVREASDGLAEQVALRTEALEAANKQLEEWSLHDALTGAYNRRAFDADLRSVFDLARRQGKARFALILADIDHFQAYNDAYGTAAGDQVLRTLFRTLTRQVGQGDRVYRHGGARIAMILTEGEAVALDGRVREILEGIAELALPHQQSPHGIVTLSAGLARYKTSMDAAADMVGLAEKRLDQARQDGRNRLVA